MMIVAPANAVRFHKSNAAAAVSATPMTTRNHTGKCHWLNACAQPLVFETGNPLPGEHPRENQGEYPQHDFEQDLTAVPHKLPLRLFS